jgi:hypothetical protein
MTTADLRLPVLGARVCSPFDLMGFDQHRDGNQAGVIAASQMASQRMLGLDTRICLFGGARFSHLLPFVLPH